MKYVLMSSNKYFLGSVDCNNLDEAINYFINKPQPYVSASIKQISAGKIHIVDELDNIVFVGGEEMTNALLKIKDETNG